MIEGVLFIGSVRINPQLGQVNNEDRTGGEESQSRRMLNPNIHMLSASHSC